MADGLFAFCHLCTLIVLFEICFSDSSVKILNDESFEHLTQASTGATTGDWFIVFSFTDKDPECVECKQADEAIAKAQEKHPRMPPVDEQNPLALGRVKLSHKLNFALVLPPKSKLTLKRFDVARWPFVILLKQGKQYTYFEGKMDEESFVKFIEQGYKLSPAQPVPPPVSKFGEDTLDYRSGEPEFENRDVFVEDLMGDVKHMIHMRKNAAAVIFLAGILFGLMLTPVLRLLTEFLINSFTQEPEQEDEGLGKDEVDEEVDENGDEEKKNR